jgi:tetratricopeptide (TPR) repeat protein
MTSTSDELMTRAQQHLRASDIESALACLGSAVQWDPGHGAAGLLITTLHQADRIEEAFALGSRYWRYWREGPRNPRALFRFGWLLAFTGEIESAEALYRDLVALDRGGIYEAWGHGELAYLARARGNATQAVDFMRQAIAARPDDTVSRVGLAQMLVEAGDPGAAVPLLELELQKNPAALGFGAMPAALVLGWAHRQLGDETAAAPWLASLEDRQVPGMGISQPARELAFLAVRGSLDEALQLAGRITRIALYGAPDPHDGMYASLENSPAYKQLLHRSIEHVNAERSRLGWAPLAPSYRQTKQAAA